MKKKLLVGLAAGLLMSGIAGMANATPYSNTQDWSGSGTDGTIDYLQIGTASNSAWDYTWTQTVVFDSEATAVSSAKLILSHKGNQDNNPSNTNEVWFLSGGTSVVLGTLSNSVNQWVDDEFDIKSLFTAFPSSSFTLTLKLTEDTNGNDTIRLGKSLIYGEYTPQETNSGTAPVPEPATSGTAPVPEPATMLLFGTGLVGLMGVARRKKK